MIIQQSFKKIYNHVFSNFFNFLKNKNILSLGLAFIISMNVNKLSNDFISSIVSPLINRIFGTESDIQLKDRKITIFGITFLIGNFINSLIQFIVILYIVYWIYTFTEH